MQRPEPRPRIVLADLRGSVPPCRLWLGGHQWANWAQEKAVKHPIKHIKHSRTQPEEHRTRTKLLYTLVPNCQTRQHARAPQEGSMLCVFLTNILFQLWQANQWLLWWQAKDVDWQGVETVFSDDFWKRIAGIPGRPGGCCWASSHCHVWDDFILACRKISSPGYSVSSISKVIETAVLFLAIRKWWLLSL